MAAMSALAEKEETQVGATQQLLSQDKKRSTWPSLGQWVSCICVVTFDLELGQAIEAVFPEDYPLSSQEKINICYLAFPDSNSSQIGDSQFHFRIMCSGPGNGGCPLDPALEVHGTHPSYMMDPGNYYGYSFFRQVRDAELKRGYFQKSIVLLTRLPYHTLFYRVLELVAPEYFDNGPTALEAVCFNINAWPRPIPGRILSLPCVGSVLYIRIPMKSDNTSSQRALTEAIPRSPSTIVLPHISQVNYYQVLHPLLPHFELLWELVLLNEPIAVIGPSPTLVAQAVEALVSLIRPLKYYSDYRPYFTIHDADFKHVTTKKQAPPAMILGVTNPFFNKALDHWPHIIKLGEPSHAAGKLSTSKGLYSRKNTGANSLDEAAGKSGIYTSYRPFLKSDGTLVKLLSSSESLPGRRPVEAQNVIIRKHALELTTSFVIPLERYLASLMPLKKDVLPWRRPPQLRPFDAANFRKALEVHGPQLTSKVRGNWSELYRQFFESPNFAGWFQYRQLEANQKLRLLHVELLCKADINFWMRGKHELEVVDFLIRIKTCLVEACQNYPPVNQHAQDAIRSQVQAIISRLPSDLQASLKVHHFVPFPAPS